MKTVCENKIEELNLLADGMLDTQSRVGILKHMEGCDGCRQYFEDIKAIKDGMGRLELKAPAGLTASIMSEIGKKDRKQKTIRRLYYVSSVAAACLVVAFAVFISGGLGLWSGKSEDLSEALPPGADNGMKNMEQEMDSDGVDKDLLGMGGSDEAFTITSSCEPEEAVDDGRFQTKGEALEGYSYYTSAFADNRPVLVNENGTPLDSSIEKEHDVFFVSPQFTFDEIEDIIYGEFSDRLKEISTETRESVDYISFRTDYNTLTVIEDRLKLVSSALVEEGTDGILAGISSSVSE